MDPFNKAWFWMMVIGWFMLGFGVGNFYCTHAHGEDFKYNMTKYLDDETKIIDLCMHSDIKIPNCDILVGKINSTYGDKMK